MGAQSPALAPLGRVLLADWFNTGCVAWDWEGSL